VSSLVIGFALPFLSFLRLSSLSTVVLKILFDFLELATLLAPGARSFFGVLTDSTASSVFSKTKPTIYQYYFFLFLLELTFYLSSKWLFLYFEHNRFSLYNLYIETLCFSIN
jgi:intracellular septation protein A